MPQKNATFNYLIKSSFIKIKQNFTTYSVFLCVKYGAQCLVNVPHDSSTFHKIFNDRTIVAKLHQITRLISSLSLRTVFGLVTYTQGFKNFVYEKEVAWYAIKSQDFVTYFHLRINYLPDSVTDYWNHIIVLRIYNVYWNHNNSFGMFW